MMARHLYAAERLCDEPRTAGSLVPADNLVKGSTPSLELAELAKDVYTELRAFGAVNSKDNLVPAFQKFTGALLVFASHCDGEKSGMEHDIQRRRLSAKLKSLKKLIPVLKSVTQNRAQYPNNVHAKASCELVEGHIRHSVEGIVKAIGVKTDLPEEEPAEVDIDTEAHFAADVSKLVHLLSPKHRRSLLPDVNTLVTRVVSHAMMVAVTSREGSKDEITRVSQEVLNLQEEVTVHHKALEGYLDQSQLVSDFDQSCENLARKVLLLEGAIKNAVIQQTVDVLVETIEPMTRIVKAATVQLKDGRSLTDKDCLSVLQPLDDTLHDHMDHLCQVGTFVASSCSDVNKVQRVTKAIKAIERLDPEVLPACLAVRRDCRDRTAVAHVKLVYKEWCHEVQALVDVILDILDLEKFLEISECSLELDLEDCRHAVLMPDSDFLAESINKILGRAKQVLRVGEDIQNRNEDALYRNGVQIFLDQIQNALTLVKNGGTNAVRNIKDPLVQGQLKERCQHLIEAIRLLREGVNPKNQPDLMNPLRENVRSGITKRAESFQNDGDFGSRVSPTEFSSSAPPRLSHSHTFSASPLPQRSSTPVSLRHPASTDDAGMLPSQMASDSRAEHHGMEVHPGFISLSLPELDTSPLPGSSSLQGLSRHRPSSGDVRKITSQQTKDFKSGPVFKLDLVFPAGDIVRGVFQEDHEGFIQLLNQLKTKSTSLCRIAEGISSVRTLKSINPALASALMKTTDTLYSNVMAALSGDQTHQAESVLAADKWSSEYIALEESIAGSLQPLDGVFGVTEASSQVQTAVIQDVQGSISRMVSTLLDTMKADKYCAMLPDVSHQVIEWKNLCSDLLRETEQYNTDPEDCSLRDQLSHKRMLCVIKLSRLLEVAIGYLRKRQERWLEVVSSDRWMTEARDWVLTMKKETDVYIGLCDLVTSWNTSKTDVDQMTRVKEYIEDICMLIADPKEYKREGLTSFYIIEWCCLMHQLSDWLDRLSADGALRVDRLLSSAHAAHTSSGPSKQHFLVELQGQSDALSSVASQVRQAAVSALVGVSSHTHKTMVLTSLDELCRVTPKLISLTRDLADDLLPSLSELNHVKRLWVCHATAIVRGLQGLPNIDEKKITEIERCLRGVSTYGSILQDTTTPQPSWDYYVHNHHHETPGLHTPYERSTYRSLRGISTPTGKAGNLYADTSYTWQGKDPRLVTSSKQDNQSAQRSKSYRSQTLGLNDTSTNAACASPLPAAPCKPSLERTYSAECYSSIEATALMLQQEADKWESSDNSYIQTIKRLSENMTVLTGYAKRPDSGIPKSKLVQAARVIATEAKNIHRFAEIFTRHAKDVQLAGGLAVHLKQIPALATQLNIIATVKSATPPDYNSDVVIVTNAEQLMEAVIKTLNAAEMLCVKGLRVIEGATPEEAAAASLAAQLKRKLQRHRQIEASSRETDALGLRRISKHNTLPSLTEILQKIS